MRFVQPKVSPEDAKKILVKRPKLSLRRRRDMRKMELLYLPYYLYRAVISQGGEQHEVLVCTDGISCGFSFFDTRQTAFCDEASGEVFDFVVSAEESRRTCLDNLRWHLLRQGLRLKVRATVGEIRDAGKIYYPYWLAYFKGDGGYDFRIADAVTGEIQGVRMRRTLLAAFSQARATGEALRAAGSHPRGTHRPANPSA